MVVVADGGAVVGRRWRRCSHCSPAVVLRRRGRAAVRVEGKKQRNEITISQTKHEKTAAPKRGWSGDGDGPREIFFALVRGKPASLWVVVLNFFSSPPSSRQLVVFSHLRGITHHHRTRISPRELITRPTVRELLFRFDGHAL